MNNSKITFEYVKGSANLSSIADDLGISQAQAATSIFSFLKTHPESSWYAKILRKLQVEITKNFLESDCTAKEFAECYGMTEHRFVCFMSNIIDDTSLIVSNTLAKKLYLKLLKDRFSIGAQTPKRIIQIIGLTYVQDNWITIDSIASLYGLSHSSVSYLLHRGVDKGIFDNNLANLVFHKLQTKKWQLHHSI